MVINEKALVREMKQAYRYNGYTVMVMPSDRWVIKSKGEWAVVIQGQDNVPNEVLALIVLHMGKLPKPESSCVIYKGEKCSVIQKEVYATAAADFAVMENERLQTEDEPVELRRTGLVYGRRRVWQQTGDLRIRLINPAYESLMDQDGTKMVRNVGDRICLEGEISCVYIYHAAGGASEALVEHLAQVKWT